MIDGIQFSSGCTEGKSNIKILDQQLPEVTFTLKNKEVTIKLKFKIANHNLEEMAMEIYKKTPQEYFKISKNF